MEKTTKFLGRVGKPKGEAMESPDKKPKMGRWVSPVGLISLFAGECHKNRNTVGGRVAIEGAWKMETRCCFSLRLPSRAGGNSHVVVSNDYAGFVFGVSHKEISASPLGGTSFKRNPWRLSAKF